MENQSKISFFKKVLWSTLNLKKYDELISLGLKKSIKYFMGLLAILTIILSIIAVYIQSRNVNEIVGYLNENLPEFSLEKEEDDYKLSLEKKDVTILEDSKFLEYFKNVVVLNDNLEEKEAIKEYSTLANSEHNCIVFLKDECIVITQNQGEVTKYKYAELLTKYTGQNGDKYNKISVINYFGNVSYSYYIFVYFINYFIILLVVFALDVLVVGVLALIFAKILKIQVDNKNIFTLAIYALTLSAILYIIYLIVSYFTKYSFAYINVVNMIIAYIYVVIYFMKKRRNVLQDNK